MFSLVILVSRGAAVIGSLAAVHSLSSGGSSLPGTVPAPSGWKISWSCSTGWVRLLAARPQLCSCGWRPSQREVPQRLLHSPHSSFSDPMLTSPLPSSFLSPHHPRYTATLSLLLHTSTLDFQEMAGVGGSPPQPASHLHHTYCTPVLPPLQKEQRLWSQSGINSTATS